MIIIDNSNKFELNSFKNITEINLNKYLNSFVLYTELLETPISLYIDEEEIVLNELLEYYDSFFESTQGNVLNPANYEIMDSNIDYNNLFDNNENTYIQFDENSYIIIKVNNIFRLWTKSVLTDNISNLLIQKLDENFNIIEVIDNKEEFKIQNVFTLSSIELNPGIYKFTLLPNENNEYIRKDSEWFFERKITLYKSNEINVNKIVNTIKYNTKNYFIIETKTFEINQINDFNIYQLKNTNLQQDMFYNDIIWKVDITDTNLEIYSNYQAIPHVENVEIKKDEYGNYALIGQGNGGIIGLEFSGMNIDFEKGFYWYAIFGNDINDDYNFTISNKDDDYDKFNLKILKNNLWTKLFYVPLDNHTGYPIFTINPCDLNLVEINLINNYLYIYLNGMLKVKYQITYTYKTYFDTIFIGNDTKDFNYNFNIENYIKLYSTTMFNKGLTEQAREDILNKILNSYNLNIFNNETIITKKPIILNSNNFDSIIYKEFEETNEKLDKSYITNIDNKIEIIEDKQIEKLELTYSNNLTNFSDFEIIAFNKFKSTENINEYISNGNIKKPIIKEINDDGTFTYTVEPIDISNGIYKLTDLNINVLNLNNKEIKPDKTKGNNTLEFNYYSKTEEYPSLGFNFNLIQNGLSIIDGYENNQLKLNTNLNNKFLILNNYYGIVDYNINDDNAIITNINLNLIKFEDDIIFENDEIFDNYHILYENEIKSANFDLTNYIDNEVKNIIIKFKAYRIGNWKENDEIFINLNGEKIWSKTGESDLIYNDDGTINVYESLKTWNYCSDCENTTNYEVQGFVDVEISIPFNKAFNNLEIGCNLTYDKTEAYGGIGNIEIYIEREINNNNTLIIPNIEINITNHQDKTYSYNSLDLDKEINYPFITFKKENTRMVGFNYNIKLTSELIETFEKLYFNTLTKYNPYLPKDCSNFENSGEYIIYPYNVPIEIYYDKDLDMIYIFEHEYDKKINMSLYNKIYYNNLEFNFDENNGLITLFNNNELNNNSIEFEFKNILEEPINKINFYMQFEGNFNLTIKKLLDNETYSIVYNSDITDLSEINIDLNNLNTQQINIKLELEPKTYLKIEKMKFGLNK